MLGIAFTATAAIERNMGKHLVLLVLMFYFMNSPSLKKLNTQ